jgi:uncharacterized protein YyaL (SSP411 family)
MKKGDTNKLGTEKSPYLLQHAKNPVHWYPWSEEAFEKARDEDKPIFLSIGYSTCHWCHVMAEESFEDKEVAHLLNKGFISIKVDREERPDIDNVYMQFCQRMTGSGGWPLTIMMTHDKKPFYAGTYIPKEARFGRTGMVELLPRVIELWTQSKTDLVTAAEQITSALQQPPGESKDGKTEITEQHLKITYNQLARNYDSEYGGFSREPKFPSPHNLLFLLRFWNRTGDERVLEMVEKTLRKMRVGGLYDHIGFGFHRYSTDREWLLPHFEKMLYDQAMLAVAYIEAYQATGKNEYKTTAQEIFTYVLRDMTAPEGGFYSAEDADSEGEEGKFYTWSKSELQSILSKQEYKTVEAVYNINSEGNFKDQALGRKTGQNIIHKIDSDKKLADQLSVSVEKLKEQLESIRQKLFDTRNQRIRPHKDDKILTDWNGLMIAAFAMGARVFEEPQYSRAAEKAVSFILATLRDKEGRLLHRYRDKAAGIPANLDDFAFLVWGLIELYHTTFKPEYLDLASELNSQMLEHFEDHANGGLFFTADDSEELLIRQKEYYDGAIPSGNSVAFYNMIRLSRLIHEPDLEKKASMLIGVFSEGLASLPLGHTMMMTALNFSIGPAFEVVIKGEPDASETKEMIKALRKNYLPNIITLLNPEKSGVLDFNLDIPGEHALESVPEKKTKAYVCVNYTCKEPTASVSRMLELLKGEKKRK